MNYQKKTIVFMISYRGDYMYSAIILGAGSGKRLNLGFNKVLFKLKDKEVISYSIDFFKKDNDCKEIILVVSDVDFRYMIDKYQNDVDAIVIGGEERQNSVYNALKKVNEEYVLIHDGARPFIPLEAVEELKKALPSHKSLTLAVSVKDTIKDVENGYVISTLKRERLVNTQTPQAFHTKEILSAHKRAIEESFLATDDTMLLDKYYNIKTKVVNGDYRNIKLTTKDDLVFLEVIM